jgi:hypothetical protein
MGTWIRDTWTAGSYNAGSQLLASIAAGDTLLRVHLRWGIVGDTSIDIDYAFQATNIITLGLCTTVGDGTEHAPNARTQAADQDPPTQRWVYWETRGIRPTYLDTSVGSVGWIDTGSSEPTDTKGQVLATGIPAGQTLNLWASWASAFDWDSSGSVTLWGGASILTSA